MVRDHLQPYLGDMLPPKGYHLRTKPTTHMQHTTHFCFGSSSQNCCSSLTTCDAYRTDAASLDKGW